MATPPEIRAELDELLRTKSSGSRIALTPALRGLIVRWINAKSVALYARQRADVLSTELAAVLAPLSPSILPGAR
jgi:hypothetical protein